MGHRGRRKRPRPSIGSSSPPTIERSPPYRRRAGRRSTFVPITWRPTNPWSSTHFVILSERLRQRGRKRGNHGPAGGDLAPTNAGDIQACLEKLVRDGLDSVATFHEAELNPHRAWKIEGGGPEVFIPGAVPWLPRQKLPKAYQLNGAVVRISRRRTPGRHTLPSLRQIRRRRSAEEQCLTT